MVISWDENAEWRHDIKTENSSFERVEEFKYLETTLTNENYIEVDINTITAKIDHSRFNN
jgi:hypothetical protein